MSMIVYFRAATSAEIAELHDHPDRIDAFMFDGDDAARVDFDKAWHAVHFLLTGSDNATASPLSLIIDGTPPQSAGFGSTEFWTASPARMREFADALEAVSDETLMLRYDPAPMVAGDVYLADVFAEEGKEAVPYLMQGLPALRALASRCAIEGLGVVKALG